MLYYVPNKYCRVCVRLYGQSSGKWCKIGNEVDAVRVLTKIDSKPVCHKYSITGLISVYWQKCVTFLSRLPCPELHPCNECGYDNIGNDTDECKCCNNKLISGKHNQDGLDDARCIKRTMMVQKEWSMCNAEINVGDVVKAVNKTDSCRFRIGVVTNVTDKAVELLSSHKEKAQNWLVSRNDFYVLRHNDID